MATLKGFMCMTDFTMDLPAGAEGVVHASIDGLRKTGHDTCGIVEVEVKLVRVVQEPDIESHSDIPSTEIPEGVSFAEYFEKSLTEARPKHGKK